MPANQVPIDAALAAVSLNSIATDALGIGDEPRFDSGLFDVPIRSARTGCEIVVFYGNLRR